MGEWHEWNDHRMTDQLSEICKSLHLHQTVNNKSLIDQNYCWISRAVREVVQTLVADLYDCDVQGQQSEVAMPYCVKLVFCTVRSSVTYSLLIPFPVFICFIINHISYYSLFVLTEIMDFISFGFEYPDLIV